MLDQLALPTLSLVSKSLDRNPGNGFYAGIGSKSCSDFNESIFIPECIGRSAATNGMTIGTAGVSSTFRSVDPACGSTVQSSEDSMYRR